MPTSPPKTVSNSTSPCIQFTQIDGSYLCFLIKDLLLGANNVGNWIVFNFCISIFNILNNNFIKVPFEYMYVCKLLIILEDWYPEACQYSHVKERRLGSCVIT